MKPFTRLKLLILIVSMVVISVTSMGYLIYTSHSIVKHDIPQVSVLKEAISEMHQGHLWLEEYLSGDRSIYAMRVIERYEEAVKHMQLLLTGGQTDLLAVEPLEDRYLRATAKQLADIGALLQALAHERMINLDDRGAGSPMDRKFDQHFNEFNAIADHMVDKLSETLSNKTIAFSDISYLLIAFVIAGGVFSYGLIAVYSKVLLRKDRDLTAKLEALQVSHEISRFTFDTGPLEQVLEQILHKVLSLGPYRSLSKGAIFLKDSDGQTMRIAAHVNFHEGLLARCETLAKGQCHCGQVWDSGQAMILHDHEPGVDDVEGHGHYILPIQYHGGVLGVLNLFAAGALKEEAQQQQLMETIANTIAGVIIRKRYEEELLRAKIEAEAGREVKNRLLQTMSHELRTPLNGILGFTDVLQNMSRQDLDRQDYDSFLQSITDSAERLLGVVDAILDLSSIDSGKLTLNEEQLNCYALYATLMALLKGQIEGKGLHVEHNIPRDLPYLWADEHRVRQVLYNLLSNALHFTPSGGTILFRCFQEPDGALGFTIQDTGVGMSAEDIQIALDRFSQVDMSRTRKEEGIGLGLPLAKHLMELHGGHLTIESVLGHGTAVTVRFPPHRSRAVAA